MKYLKLFENFNLDILRNKISALDKELRILLGEIIDSNDLEEIKKTVDSLPKEHISPVQFLFRRVYELENDLIANVEVKSDLDFDGIRSKINDIIPSYLEAQKRYSNMMNRNVV